MITTSRVVDAAMAQHGADLDAERLGTAYEDLLTTDQRRAGGVFYTPGVAASMLTRAALDQAIAGVGDDPSQLLRIQVIDPACGAGIFLVEAAKKLAHAYAARLAEPTRELVAAVAPFVILRCIHGIDIDPIAVDLARLALSLETDLVLPPAALRRHVIVGDPLSGAWPPAFPDPAPLPAPIPTPGDTHGN